MKRFFLRGRGPREEGSFFDNSSFFVTMGRLCRGYCFYGNVLLEIVDGFLGHMCMGRFFGADGQVKGISCDGCKITFSQPYDQPVLGKEETREGFYNDHDQAVSPPFCMPAEEESFCERMKRFSLALNTDSDLTDTDLSTNTYVYTDTLARFAGDPDSSSTKLEALWDDINTETLARFADDPDSLSTKLEALRDDINTATALPRDLDATLDLGEGGCQHR